MPAEGNRTDGLLVRLGESAPDLPNSHVLTLGDFTSPDLILLNSRAAAAGDLLRELCVRLQASARLTEDSALYEAVMQREKICSTAVPPGWAMPHARSAQFERLRIAIGRCAQGMRWFGQTEVRVVFLFIVPEAEAALYISLISALAKLSQNAAQLAEFDKAKDARALFEFLAKIQVRLPRQKAVGAYP